MSRLSTSDTAVKVQDSDKFTGNASGELASLRNLDQPPHDQALVLEMTWNAP
jgi:hypothetical protein